MARIYSDWLAGLFQVTDSEWLLPLEKILISVYKSVWR